MTLLGEPYLMITSANNKTNWHELRIIAVNGRVLHLSKEYVHAMLTSRILLVPLVLFCGMIALIDTDVLFQPAPFPTRFGYWIMNGLLVAQLWYLLFRISLKFKCITGIDIIVPSLFMMGVSVVCSMQIAITVWPYIIDLGDTTNLTYPPIEILRYFTVSVVFEGMFVTLLFDRLRKTLHKANPRLHEPNETFIFHEDPTLAAPATISPKRKATQQILVNDQTINLNNIIYIKSIEHYAEFVSPTCVKTHRIALRDITKQLDPSIGVQPHRSYWVHRDAITSKKHKNRNLFLILTNGDLIPVSRARKAAVTQWLNDYEAGTKKDPGI